MEKDNDGATEAPKEDNGATQPYRKLYRLPRDSKIAGVCAGLAEYFMLDVTLIRVVFVILTLASGGFGIILYLILAVVIPADETQKLSNTNTDTLGENVRNLTDDMRSSGSVDRMRNLFGLGLILLGGWLLLMQLFPGWLTIDWSVVWPAILIILGVLFAAGSRRRV